MERDAITAALVAYEVGEELGRGSWGVVYAGRHRRLERDVAIKLLAPAVAADEGVRARFLAEGRVLASLEHPHVVPVYDAVEHDGHCMLVMERLRGGSLADRVPLAPPAAVAVALAAAAGLQHAHDRGLLHRDVKPDNLLFGGDGVLKVTDFGIAKVVGAAAPLLTAPGDALGTPAFMAPEQIRGGPLSAAADTYALAATLYLALAGSLPFDATGDVAAVLYRRAHEPARPLEAPELPAAIAAIVDAALALDPAERPESVEGFGIALSLAARDAWGPDWLAASGVPLRAAGAIADAARGGAVAATVVAAPVGLDRARSYHASRTWTRAFETLASLDTVTPLACDGLELLADSAYMLGHLDEHVRALERAYAQHLDAGDDARAARCAFWLGTNLVDAGEFARGSGWLARLAGLGEAEDAAGSTRAYALIGEMYRHVGEGDFERALATGAEAQLAARDLRDRDCSALGVGMSGVILALGGRTRDGLRLLDEAIVAVTAGETSPLVSGTLYCGAILGCRAAFEPRRAHEWTSAMSAWCDGQTGLVAFSGVCQVHRSQLLQLRGEWDAALDEAHHAGERCLRGRNTGAAGEAAYVAGDVYRVRGLLVEAEAAYREASRLGRDPQPGLALLRVAQGRTADAAAAMRRVLDETGGAGRTGMLPAQVDVMLAAGDPARAAAAVSELDQIAETQGFAMVRAMACSGRGAIALADGDARAALPALRESRRLWDELQAPYETARARALMACALADLGDTDAAELEREAAREIFQRLGAAPDLARLER